MVGERRMRGEESVRLEEEGVFLHLHFIFRETNIRIYLYFFLSAYHKPRYGNQQLIQGESRDQVSAGGL